MTIDCSDDDEVFSEEKRLSMYDAAEMDLSPPFNVYVGRDTSVYAMTDFAPSMTKQEFTDECDINNIMARYAVTGLVPTPDRQAFYLDEVDVPSFHEAQNLLLAAEAAFMSLPSSVRREFDNDPAKFVEFAEDEKNVGRLKDWGMLSPEAVQRLDAAEAAKAAPAAESPARPSQAAQALSEPAPPATPAR